MAQRRLQNLLTQLARNDSRIPVESKESEGPNSHNPGQGSTASRKYGYQSLGQTSIRLIRLTPGAPEDDLHCTIVHVDLNDEPDYEALSYVWGEEDDLGERLRVGIQDEAIALRKNCANALRRLRSRRGPSGSLRDLWIDAICIDQSNVDERNFQVAMMARIFSSAYQVIVYLRDSLDDAADLRIQEEMEMSLIKQKFSGDVLAFIWLLAGQNWFWRAWTVQELTLARKAVLIWCSHEFDWHVFTAVVKLHYPHSQITPVFGIAHSNDLEPLDILYRISLCGVSEPQDRIYAMQSLMPAEDRIPVDYSRTTKDGFVAFATRQISRGKGFDVLSFAQGPAGEPFWCPDWEHSRLGVKIWRHRKSYHPGLKANIEVFQDVYFDSDSRRMLRMKAFKLERLERIGAVCSVLSGSDLNWYETLADWDLLFDMSVELDRAGSTEVGPGVGDDSSESRESLGRTLVCGTEKGLPLFYSKNNTRADIRQRQTYGEIYSQWRRFIAGKASIPWPYSFPSSSGVDFFIQCTAALCTGRRLFKQRNGKFGLAPAEAMVGDEICIPLGGRIPFVVRPQHRRDDGTQVYILVGECFVDGWMEGEVFARPNETEEDESNPEPVAGVTLEEILLA